MATFDQLPAEQKAIIELVVQRARSYDDLADVLSIPTARVRELAREALTTLTPLSAARVDSDWRGQIADYVLGQQTGPESTATRGHLRRSESGRAWTVSLLDSLEELYEKGDGEMPALPDSGDAVSPRRKAREARPKRDRARDRKRERRPATKAGDGDGGARASSLRPDAAGVVRRRRIMSALAAALAVGAVALAIILLTGGDDDSGGEKQANTTQNANQQQGRIVGQLELKPVSGQKGQGVAAIVENKGKLELLLRAGVTPNERNQAYEVWLYNSAKDAVSLGAGVAQGGQLEGRQELPADLLQRYKFIDVSLEPLDRNTKHSGNSVIRGELAKLSAPQQGAQGGAGQAPAPGGQGGAIPGGQAPAP